MPTTYNGIGTTYYGRKNLRCHAGTCEHCHRQVELQDYETRLWFTIFFIPVVPLGRKQILDYCPSCTRHRAVPAHQWEQFVRQAVTDGAAEVSRRPDDPELAMGHLSMLLSLDQRQEAAALADRMARRFAANADVQLMLGACYESAGRDADADAAFARSLALEPENTQARRAVGIAAIQAGRPDRARELLRFMEPPGEEHDPAVMMMLAEAFQANQDHEQALEVLRAALAQSPALRKHRPFRKLVLASERLVPTDHPMCPPKPLMKTWPARAVLVLVIAGASLHGASWYVRTHRLVHVVNGLPTPVQVEITDGPSRTVAGGERQEIRIPEGAHEVTFVDATGRRKQESFTLPSGGFLGRFFDDHVYVLNPFGAAALTWQRAAYSDSKRKARAASTERFHVGRSFFRTGEPDRLWEDLPESVDLDHAGQVVYRTGLGILDAEPWQVISALAAEGKVPTKHLLTYAEAHLWVRPDDQHLLRQYTTLAGQKKRLDRCRAFLARGLSRRPILIDWHRGSQNLRQRAGQGEELLAEYRALLRADPNNPDLLYLVGRIPPRSSRALPYVDRALKIDPNHACSLRGRSYHMMSLGRFAEARDAAARARRRRPDDPDFADLLRAARFAAGDFEGLEKEYRQVLRNTPLNLSAHMGLMELLIAKGDRRGTRQAHEAFAGAVRGETPRDPHQLILHSHLYLMDLEGDANAMLSDAGKYRNEEMRKLAMARGHLAAGRPEEAARWMEKLADRHWYWDLLVSVALHAEGVVPAAAEWRERARGKLADGDLGERMFAEMLGRGAAVDPAAAEDVGHPAQTKAVLLVALVQAGADRRLLALAEKLNRRRDSDGRFLRRAIARLRRAPG